MKEESTQIKEELTYLFTQPWRFHHTFAHAQFVERKTLEAFGGKFEDEYTPEVIHFASMFHDVVYDPRRVDNEEKSIDVWRKYAESHSIQKEIESRVEHLIYSTSKYFLDYDFFLSFSKDIREKDLVRNFIQADWLGMKNMEDSPENRLLLEEYEKNIFLENQRHSLPFYIQGRCDFLNKAHERGYISTFARDFLKEKVNRKYRIGIYAGSFFPFHIGHLNVLRKAEKMFDKVIVAKGINPEKKDIYCQFSMKEVDEILPHHEIRHFSGQMVDYFQSLRCDDQCEYVLVRGLRDGFDLSKESTMIQFMNEQCDFRGLEHIPVVYILCDKEYEHISSSSIRMLPEEDADHYIPKNV